MQSRVAVISFLEPGDPGYPSNALPGVPVFPGNALPGSPVYPGNALPGGGGHPGHALPPPGSIATLPVFPFDPTLPDGGLPGTPGNELPGGGGGSIDNSLPVQIRPGAKFVVKWLACHGLILVPDHSLPGTGTGSAQPK